MAVAEQPRRRTTVPELSELHKSEESLPRRLLEYVALSDAGEEARRRTDRLGADLWYGRHWNIAVPNNRVAITANVAKALIHHKLAIMTKQDPIFVVEAHDQDDADAAALVRPALQQWWIEDGMRFKHRHALLCANTTRTSAAKVCWDPTLKDGYGYPTSDVMQGWRLILDPRVESIDRMEFIGHRESMTRTRAMLFYPEATDEIRDAPRSDSDTDGGMTSPIRDPWSKVIAATSNYGTVVNGKPVISAFSNQGTGTKTADDMVQIIELFYRDRTLIEKEVELVDVDGNPKKKLKMDGDRPSFKAVEDEKFTTHDGIELSIPTFEPEYESVYEVRLAPKYPQWRRSTILLPDMTIIDDMNWNGPAPYALYKDGYSLDGPWVKGSMLDLEDCQVSLNVSMSLMMDNFRFNSYRPVLAGAGANIAGDTLLLRPGGIVRVNTVKEIEPFVFPEVSESWFTWANFLIATMQQILGASGIMQGSADQAPRTDSASGFDTLAEIGGSRLVEATQMSEQAISDIGRIVGWYMQNFFTEKHAVSVETAEGTLSSEPIARPFIIGDFHYRVLTGSTMAWSESAVRARLLTELQNGLRDKISYWQTVQMPGWREIAKRLLTQPPALSGAAASPPPRTRSSPKTTTHQPKV